MLARIDFTPVEVNRSGFRRQKRRPPRPDWLDFDSGELR